MTTEATNKIVQYLSEAHATELALVRTLQAHIAMTPRGRYRNRLERHLTETREQANAIERRLGELGEGRNVLEMTWDATLTLAQGVFGQALALSKGPMDVLRGSSGEEKLLKNAKDECATEALEIATYDGLERLARLVDDTRTAELAVRHREQEERMLRDLRELIPNLVDDVVKAELKGEATFDASQTGAADNVREMTRTTQRQARRTARTTGRQASRAASRASDRAEAAADRVTGNGSSSNGGAGEPWSGYDRQNATQIRRRLNRSNRAELERVREYERTHKDRATVLRAAEEKLNG